MSIDCIDEGIDFPANFLLYVVMPLIYIKLTHCEMSPSSLDSLLETLEQNYF